MALLHPVDLSPAYVKPVFSQSEMDKLNHLIGLALTGKRMRNRLLVQRDPALQEEFDLAPETWQYITSIRFDSLKEFCDAIASVQSGDIP